MATGGAREPLAPEHFYGQVGNLRGRAPDAHRTPQARARGLTLARLVGAAPTKSTRVALRRRAQHLDRDVRDLGRRAPDAHAVALERCDLGLRAAARAADDGAGVAQRLARGRRDAGDVADDRLGHVGLDVVGGLLLGRAADLAAHDDQLRLGVVLEELADVDERRALHRLAADADHRAAADAA